MKKIWILVSLCVMILLVVGLACIKTYEASYDNMEECNTNELKKINDHNIYARLKGVYSIQDKLYDRLELKANGSVIYYEYLSSNLFIIRDSGQYKLVTLIPNITLESTYSKLSGKFILCEDILKNKNTGFEFIKQ